MPEIRPFKGTFYSPGKVALDDVVAPPYDVISPTEQDELYDRHPSNIVRLILGKQFESDTDSDNRYTRSAESLGQFRSEGALVTAEKPGIYLYQQEFEYKGQVFRRNGLMAAVQIQEYSERGILPHERTLPGAKTDRLHLLRACKANFSPVFCLYTDETASIDSIAWEGKGALRGEVHQASGVIDRIWEITDPGVLAELTSRLSAETLYIADGHHRYETSLRYRNEMREANPDAPAGQPYDYVLMFLVNTEAEGMLVLPTHRLVRDVDPTLAASLHERLQEHFQIETFEKSRKEDFLRALADSIDEHGIGLYHGSSFILLKPSGDWQSVMPADRAGEWKELDVAILHVLVLNQILGVSLDPGESKKNLVFEIDEDYVISSVDSGDFQLAAFLNPTPLSAVQRIAEIGEVMPQKSTYFYPKPLSGMVIREHNPA